MLRIKNQVLIFTLLFSQILFGQPELNGVVQPSSEASALIKQMDIGNNYATGAVQYNLPLYEIKGDLLSHAISASYASNGFTVQEEASRLGLGWNLNIGGEITRQVREIADETKYLEVIPDDTGDNAGEVNVHGGYFHNGCKNDERCDIPDIFHYSLPNGLSGKFTINQNMTTNQIPYNNVDISFDIGSINPTTLIDKNFIPSFTIKTKEGIIYKFDNYVLQKVLTINSWNNWPDESIYASSWKLTSITNVANKEEINFIYEDIGTWDILDIPTKFYRPQSQFTDCCISDSHLPGGRYSGTNYLTTIGETGTKSIVFGMEGKILKRVEWESGKIQFLSENRTDIQSDKHFSGIEIYHKKSNGLYNKIKTIDFQHSYFESSGSSLADKYKKRLRLDAIKEIAGNLSIPPTEFTYKTQNLPPKNSYQQDLWGYYNANGSSDGIPELWVYYQDESEEAVSCIKRGGNEVWHHIAGADRKSKIQYAQACMLDSIKLPTGGFHTFEYEPNNFIYKGNVISGSGVRLQRRVVNDGLQNEIIYDYKYVNEDGSTSGYGVDIPALAYFAADPNLNDPTDTKNSLFRGSSVLNTPMGGWYGYSRVEESISSAGKTVYYFKSAEHFPNEQPYNVTPTSCGNFIGKYDKMPFMLTTNHYKRGLLYKTQHFSETGNLVSEKINEPKFNSVGSKAITYEKFYGSRYGTDAGMGTQSLKFNINEEFIYSDISTEKIDGITKTTEYEYDFNHFNLSAVFNTNSDDITYKTEYKYPYDFPDNTNLHKLVEQNRDLIIEENYYVSKLNDDVLEFIQIDGIKNEYESFEDYNTVSEDDDKGPYLSEEKRYEVTWDSGGNIIDDEWQSQFLINNYDWSRGKPTSITVPGWTDPTIYSYTYSGKLNTKTYKDFITHCNYHPNTDLLSEIVEPDGQKTTFIYDNFMRLDEVKSREGKIKKEYNYNYQPNYIEEIITFDDIGTVNDITNTVKTTFDGLGRDLQIDQIGHKWNEPNTNITVLKEYNNRGLLAKIYEPDDDTNITTTDKYTEYKYYPDPLGRVESVTDPMGFTTTSTYGTNAAEIKNFTAGTLIRETTTDADEISTSIYTDKLGRLVANRTFKDNEESIIYTFYDDKSRVKVIYPPGTYAGPGTLAIANDGRIYKYTYDSADNVLTTKIPDKAEMVFKYDARNLQTAKQDANLKANGKWLRSDYDVYGRLHQQGFGTTHNGAIADVLMHNYYDKNDEKDKVNTDSIIYRGKLHKSEVNILNGFNKGSNYLTTEFTLDGYGRIKKESIEENHIELNEYVSYKYNMADNILTNKHKVGNAITTETFEFDSKGRLTTNKFSLTGKGNKTIANYNNYSLKDEVLSKNIGSKTSGYLQKVDYAYNHNGWLTTINGGSILGSKTNCKTINSIANSDLFALDIRYNDATLTNHVDRENGNIAEIFWQVKDRARNAYSFQYDFLNRLKEATHFVGSTYRGYYDTRYSYDARGNIMTLSRNGLTGNGTSCTVNQIDNLTYMYKSASNQLAKVFDSECEGGGLRVNPITNANYEAGYIISDAKTNTNLNANNNNRGTINSNHIQFKAGTYISLEEGFSYNINGSSSGFDAIINSCPSNANLSNHGFKGAESSYQYDGNGNLTKDSQKQLSIVYNHLNLPYKAEKDAFNKIEWLYTADGRKLQKQVTSGITTTSKNYLGNIEFVKNGISSNTLIAAYHSEGRVLNNGTWEYNLKDHLGNVRLVFKENNGNAQIVQENHYYPFGMQQNGNWVNSQTVKNDYLYNGKELNTEIGLNWSDYGARFYDAAIGRFGSVDPNAENYLSLSPYVYGANNPLRYIDPDGRDLLDKIKGYSVALIDNFTGGIINLRDDVSFNDASDFNLGQDAGDVSSLLMGMAEIEGGAATIIASGGATVVSGGTLSPATATTASAGALAVGHGTVVVTNAANSLVNQKGRVKSNDVVSSTSGAKIDSKTGQKVGGSGKARSHTVKHSSKKKAKDAARAGGKGTPVKHTKDAKGGNHYHSGSGKKGKGKGTKEYGSKSGKISNNVHHEYPK